MNTVYMRPYGVTVSVAVFCTPYVPVIVTERVVLTVFDATLNVAVELPTPTVTLPGTVA